MSETPDMPAAGPVDRAVDVYGAQGWLRAAVQLVPFGVGSAVDALITTRGSELARRRIETLVEELKAAVERIGQEKIDRAFVGSEAWDDLVIRAFRAAAETRHRDKVRLFAAILAGSAAVDRDAQLDAEALLSTVAQLTGADLAVARALYDVVGPPPTSEEAELNDLQRWLARTRDEWIPPAQRDDVTFHLHRLESAGLIAEITGGYYDYQGGAYRMTAAFERLMRLVGDVARETPTAADDHVG